MKMQEESETTSEEHSTSSPKTSWNWDDMLIHSHQLKIWTINARSIKNKDSYLYNYIEENDNWNLASGKWHGLSKFYGLCHEWLHLVQCQQNWQKRRRNNDTSKTWSKWQNDDIPDVRGFGAAINKREHKDPYYSLWPVPSTLLK